MLLIEADGKALFRAHGIKVPDGALLHGPSIPGTLSGEGPWIVKAQVPAGGRGKAGGVVRCPTLADASTAAGRLIGTRLKGHAVTACLVERVARGMERYLAIMVDPASYGLRVLYAAQGGVDIEQSAAVQTRLCPPHVNAAVTALQELIADEPEHDRARLIDIGRSLAALVMERELAMAEINPLFLSDDDAVAGDAKIVVDLSAIDRQPDIAALITARPDVYLDANRKLTEGFDFVELDPEGSIGLVTTGAGLSMMLIDELTARGARPLNFCDIRTGQMRGSPARLMRVLEWITARPSLRAVLVNIFAGITDLGEFATLLATAAAQTPTLRVPMVARLVGRGADDAKRILQERMPGMLVTEDLDEALAEIDAILARAGDPA